MRRGSLTFILVLFSIQLYSQTNPNDSGGILSPEQAAYDVTFYDLDMRIDPADSSIQGILTMYANITIATEHIVLNLDTLLTVEKILNKSGNEHRFSRDRGNIWIEPGRTLQPGEFTVFKIHYHGKPRSGQKGKFNKFIWAETAGGEPWVGVSCEYSGADIWWPCKDHPSDEPDSMALHFTVPENLLAVSNGRLISSKSNQDGTRTFDWFVSSPISNYSVSVYVAPYVEIQEKFKSVSGDVIPVSFWALPENESKAKEFLPGFLEHLAFFEKLLGPYPFRSDKYGITEAPYLGMEHQTVIAYGGNYDFRSMGDVDWGFDALHQHELAHEWFANLVSPSDWSDLWLSEGLASYMQIIYAEHKLGKTKADELMEIIRSYITNKQPVVLPRGAIFSEAYDMDVYFKGASMLHTLRHLIGDQKFNLLLRRWAYPDPEDEKKVNGEACRFVSTPDFEKLAEKISGMKLDWFFGVYLYQKDLPVLNINKTDNFLNLTWAITDHSNFPMPVDIKIDGKIQRVELPGGHASVPLTAESKWQIDPGKWILFATGDTPSPGVLK
ncbi:MAG: M1 family metallopeptidase [Calditrichaceae bacterium]